LGNDARNAMGCQLMAFACHNKSDKETFAFVFLQQLAWATFKANRHSVRNILLVTTI